MTNTRRIGLIGMGEVGQVLANDLHGLGDIKLGAWDRLFAVEGSEPWCAARALPFLEAASLWPTRSTIARFSSAVTADERGAAAAEAAQSLTPTLSD
jgi:hypothetical protein